MKKIYITPCVEIMDSVNEISILASSNPIKSNAFQAFGNKNVTLSSSDPDFGDEAITATEDDIVSFSKQRTGFYQSY